MRKLEQALVRLHDSVQEQKLFPAGAKLLLCCSGGADSLALVHLFSLLRSRMQITLLAVHVDHQLRGVESAADAELVKESCLRLNIPVIVRKVRLEGSGDLENQARKKRFEVFRQILELYKFDFIVTAHHNNDQVETMLMNLCRGAGLNGLAGIKPRSGIVLHPLLIFNKSELTAILEEAGVAWREDATNLDQRFRRNWIRHTLIPLLEKELNPELGTKLGWQAQIFAEAENLARQKAVPLLKKMALEQTPESVTLALPLLLKASRLEQYYILKSVVSALSGSEQDFFVQSFEELRSLLTASGSKSLKLGNGLQIRKLYNELVIAQASDPEKVPEPFTVEEDRSRAVWGNYRFSFKVLRVLPVHREEDKHNVYLDADKVIYPFTIRSRRPGDRFMPLGMKQLQKLKEYFINVKVPKFERDYVPVFDDGDKIFWIAGHRVDARAAIDAQSQRFMHIKAELVHEKPMRAASRSKKTGEDNE